MAAGAECPKGCKCKKTIHGTPESLRRFKSWLEELSFALHRASARALHKTHFRFRCARGRVVAAEVAAALP